MPERPTHLASMALLVALLSSIAAREGLSSLSLIDAKGANSARRSCQHAQRDGKFHPVLYQREVASPPTQDMSSCLQEHLTTLRLRGGVLPGRAFSGNLETLEKDQQEVLKNQPKCLSDLIYQASKRAKNDFPG
jgi:hypothetical protein